MKISTWNINGIRAVTGKSGVSRMLKSLEADVVCLQETKVTRDMLDEPTAIVDGFESYFSFSRKRTGYSGTANYCVNECTPVRAEEGLTGRLSADVENNVGCYGNMSTYQEKDLDALDAEGRCVMTQHRIRLPGGLEKEVVVINVYVPRAGDRPERRTYKLKFLSLLRNRARALLRKGRHVIILGDLNLTHTALDNCDPKSDPDFLHQASRVWINNMLLPNEKGAGIAPWHDELSEVALSSDVEDSDGDSEEGEYNRNDGFAKVETGDGKDQSPTNVGERSTKSKSCTVYDSDALSFSDVYRRLHPAEEAAYTNWSTSTDARKSNFGRRLDYILVDSELSKHVTDCCIQTEVMGSDHCPVTVTLACQALPSDQPSPPQLCSRLMPEFRGQQQKLSSFFSTKTPAAACSIANTLSSPSSVSSSPQVLSQFTQKAPGNSSSPLKASKSLPKTIASMVPKKPDLKRSSTTKTASLKDGAPPQKVVKLQQKSSPKQVSLSAFFAPKPNKEVVNEKSLPAKEDNDSVIYVEDDVSFKAGQKTKESSKVDNKKHAAADSKSADSSPQPGMAQGILEQPISSSLTEIPPSSSLAQASASLGASKCSVSSWKSLLSGPAPPPLCPGHREPCSLKTVRKNGPNRNKQFYSCPRPDGPPGNKEFRCNFFLWYHEHQNKSKKS